jgi:hypothetical protein
MARRLGLHSFTTGKPCKNGHVGPRYTKNGKCVECLSQRAKASYEARRPPERSRRLGKPIHSERIEADRLGLPTYTTGEPCKRGHMAPRDTREGKCIACVQEQRKRRSRPGEGTYVSDARVHVAMSFVMSTVAVASSAKRITRENAARRRVPLPVGSAQSQRARQEMKRRRPARLPIHRSAAP